MAVNSERVIENLIKSVAVNSAVRNARRGIIVSARIGALRRQI